MFKMLYKNKTLAVFLLALILLFPSASVRPAQMLSKTLLVSVGIDKTEAGYEVSGAMVVNKFSSSGETQEVTVVSGEGASINSAIVKISANQGRNVSFAHCNLIILGVGLQDENIATVLTYFLNNYEISNNALVVYTDANPKEIQEISVKNKTVATAGLAETIAAQARRDSGFASTLEGFYKNYLRTSSTTTISVLALKDENLDNPREVAVFRGGRFAVKLESDESEILGLFAGGKTSQPFIVTTDEFKVTLSLENKSFSLKPRFEEGKPVLAVNCAPKFKVHEVISMEKPERYLDVSSAPQEQIRDELGMRIMGDLVSLIEKCRLVSADIFGAYDIFYKRKTSAFKNFVAQFENAQTDNERVDRFLLALEYAITINPKLVV